MKSTAQQLARAVKQSMNNSGATSLGHAYLTTFSDHSVHYSHIVQKHNDFFTAVSRSFGNALDKIDKTDITSVRLTYQNHDKSEAVALTNEYINIPNQLQNAKFSAIGSCH